MSIIREKEIRIEQMLLDRLGNETFLPGLERVKSFISNSLDLLKKMDLKVATIGGTNGKGETAFFLNQLLYSENINSCVWSSPHVSSIRERFRFGDDLISYDLLESLMEEVFDDIRYKDTCLSYYEFLFAVFLKFCLTKSPDVVILEVGLGGRFDAVNLVEPTVCAITSISRDHQAILGNSYRQILFEKLGIVRLDIPLLTCFRSNYLFERTSKYCNAQSAPYYDLIKCSLADHSDNYSIRNRKLALQLYFYLYVKEKFFKASFKADCDKFSLVLNREEMVTIGDRTFIFIGAHNVDGMRNFVERGIQCDDLVVAFSNRSNSDIKSSLKILKRKFDRITLTTFNHTKAFTSEKLEQLDLDFSKSFEEVVESKIHTHGVTVIVGSYYFIGEVKKYFEKKDYI